MVQRKNIERTRVEVTEGKGWGTKWVGVNCMVTDENILKKIGRAHV